MRATLRFSAAFFLVFAVTAGAAAAQWTAAEVEVTGFNAPEGVAIDPATGMAYVSNIETATEGYWDDDKTGFISRLLPGGAVDQLRWRDSKPPALLNGPKGLCIHKGWLWVADNKRLKAYQIAGPGAKKFEILGAQRVNDMACDGKAVYVTDTARGIVIRIDDAGGLSTIKGPKWINGITFFKDKMYAVSWSEHDLYELDQSGKAEAKPFGLAAHFKNLDAVEVLDDGTFIVSDYTGGKVCTVSPDRKTVRTIITAKDDTPADFGLDRGRSLLYVPYMKTSRVVVYKLEKK